MWHWILAAKNALTRVSVSAMLREQLSLERARSAELERQVSTLKSENAELRAQLAIVRADHKQTQQELDRLKEEHSEQIHIWKTVEYRRGKRTFGLWQAFCPKCHMPLRLTEPYHLTVCSAHCGWDCQMECKEIFGFLKHLKEISEDQQQSDST